MKDQDKASLSVIDDSQLREAIQVRLNFYRDKPPYAQINVLKMSFLDGQWRAIVQTEKHDLSAGDYADVLSNVEEELVDSFGVNVLLVPAAAGV